MTHECYFYRRYMALNSVIIIAICVSFTYIFNPKTLLLIFGFLYLKYIYLIRMMKKIIEQNILEIDKLKLELPNKFHVLFEKSIILFCSYFFINLWVRVLLLLFNFGENLFDLNLTLVWRSLLVVFNLSLTYLLYNYLIKGTVKSKKYNELSKKINKLQQDNKAHRFSIDKSNRSY